MNSRIFVFLLIVVAASAINETLLCNVIKSVATSAYEGREQLLTEMARTTFKDTHMFELNYNAHTEMNSVFDGLMRLNKKSYCPTL